MLAGGTGLNACERSRLASALGVTELSLPLDPIDAPLADIARDICALDSSDPGSTAPADTRVLSPREQRDAALPAALVRAPALFDPDNTPPGDDPSLDELWIACGEGAASACNALLYESPAGSDYEAFAFSCGGRERPALQRAARRDGRGTLGCWASNSDPSLRLQATSPNWTAGGRRAATQAAVRVRSWCCRRRADRPTPASAGRAAGRTTRDCASLVGDDGSPPALAGRSPKDSPPGHDDYLDQLWERCGATEATACRDLATFGPPGSDYERYALSCGWRAVRACARLFAELNAESSVEPSA